MHNGLSTPKVKIPMPKRPGQNVNNTQEDRSTKQGNA